MEKEKQVQDVEAYEVEQLKPLYQELPGMTFGKIGETSMFDADKFLDATKSEKTVAQYLKDNAEIISKYAEILKISKKHLTIKLEGEPTMIHAALALNFASWAVPELAIYFFERMHELFLDGFSCSDRYLGAAAQRLPKQEQQPPQA